MGFEPTISADEGPKTYALDRAATGTGRQKEVYVKIKVLHLLTTGCPTFYSKLQLYVKEENPKDEAYLRMSLSDERRLEEVPGCSILLQAPITSCVLNTLRLLDRAKSCRRHRLELFLL